MKRTTWRQDFAPLIAQILAECEGQPWKDVAKRLRDECPLGLHKYWPYKVWLSEIRRKRGKARMVKVEFVPLFEGL